MDELEQFSLRMLGEPEAAGRAARSAREAGEERRERLARVVAACREATAGGEQAGSAASADHGRGDAGLAQAVAAELRAASARLPPAQREALALRGLLELDHDELAAAMAIEPSEVAPLLARSRIGLRAELRGSPVPAAACSEHERTLRAATLRQDSEPVSEADSDWLLHHLGQCQECARAHAGMLEGAACYRGWRS
jgi:hypothetical protein